jgi:small ligand-binding sensory domain FIST
MKVATSIVLGRQALPALATQAVNNAMSKAGITSANGVLLLLTSEFASNPQAAIMAAAKAAGCTQVAGCSATGIFTEEDWVLDTPAAAAMVFGGDIQLALAQHNHTGQPLLTMAAPSAINSTWLNRHSRYGGVSGDATGHGPFSVWQNAKGDVAGHIEMFLSGVTMATKASHGLMLLSSPTQVQASKQFDLQVLGKQNALSTLQKAWKKHHKTKGQPPLHLMMAVHAESAAAITQGNYHQTSIISCDDEDGSITLTHALPVGHYVSWALRDASTAEADMALTADTLVNELGSTPDFGLLFSCLGRGPYLYNGEDLDLKVITQKFPNMPLLGFYGNGEITCIDGQNQLLPYSTVLSLFTAL